MNTQGRNGWLMSLKYSEESVWGNVEDFYESLESRAIDDKIIEINSDVWGKLVRKDMAPRVGDGIVFYHSIKARFKKPDPYNRRPRISLMGEIKGIKQEGQNISWISVHIQRYDLNRLRVKPIIRDEATEYLFQQCGVVQGRVATFYEVPLAIWSEFQRLLCER